MIRLLPKRYEKYVFPVFLFLLVLPSFVSLLRPGFYSMQDDLQAFRILEMTKCLKDFQIPCRWIPDGGYGYGYPLFNFYAPSVYYLGSLINLTGIQVVDSVKILFALGFVVSFFSMYKLINKLYGRNSALLSAVLFTYAPYRAQEVYVRGALSEFWAISLTPLPLLFSYDLIKNRTKRSFLFLSLSIFLLLITHNLIPMVFFPVLLVWIVYWLISSKKIKAIPLILLSLTLGVLLSGFFIIPMLFESKYVHVNTILSGYFDYRRHFVSIKQMFLSNVFGYGSSELGTGDDLAIHTGIIHWILALGALLFSLKVVKKRKEAFVLSILLALLTLFYLFLMHLKSSFIWEVIPVLKWFQFPWRLLAGSVLTTSIMAGIFLHQFKSCKNIISIILIGITLVFYGTFFHPKDWFVITDTQKFSNDLWEKQLTISIFDYLPIFADMPPNSKAPEHPEIVTGQVNIEYYNKKTRTQRGLIFANQPSIVRLPIFYFPGMKVYVDGQEAVFSYTNCDNQEICLGQPTFSLSPGRHEVEVSLQNTFVRKIANIISALGLFGIVVIARNKNEKIF